jgi:ABC transporter substrate binding protein
LTGVSVPIVFTVVSDPVGAGYVDSLARPGGNATGFLVWEYSIAAKWLELLKEIAPRVTRAAVLRETVVAGGPALFGVIQAAAPSLGVELRPVDVRDAGEIERAITAFAQGANGGMIVTGSVLAAVHRDLIVTLAPSKKEVRWRHSLSAVTPHRPSINVRISPPEHRTLTMLNLAPSSVFLQLLAWRDGYRFTCFASRAGLDRLQLVSARHRRP